MVDMELLIKGLDIEVDHYGKLGVVHAPALLFSTAPQDHVQGRQEFAEALGSQLPGLVRRCAMRAMRPAMCAEGIVRVVLRSLTQAGCPALRGPHKPKTARPLAPAPKALQVTGQRLQKVPHAERDTELESDILRAFYAQFPGGHAEVDGLKGYVGSDLPNAPKPEKPKALVWRCEDCGFEAPLKVTRAGDVNDQRLLGDVEPCEHCDGVGRVVEA